jgi:hypothetical protein
MKSFFIIYRRGGFHQPSPKPTIAHQIKETGFFAVFRRCNTNLMGRCIYLDPPKSPLISRAVSFLVGAVPPGWFHSQENHGFVGVVPLWLPPTKDRMGVSDIGATTGGLPLQENETALGRAPVPALLA